MQLRPHQTRAIVALRDAYVAGHRRILLVAPTGFGKTIVMVALALEHLRLDAKNRVLVVVHRRELARQVSARLAAAGLPSLHVLQSEADPGDPTARVVVASVQTLHARGERPKATLVLWDEAHHLAARTFRAVAADYPGAIHVGVTATPARSDGAPLGDMFTALVQTTSIRELTAAGWLVPATVLGPATPNDALVVEPATAYIEHAAGRPAVVFCVDVDHAAHVASTLTARGVRAANVDGKLSSKLRDARLAAFEAGELDVLTSVMVLTEGYDSPRAAVCILASGVSHPSVMLQKVGRVLRPAPGKTSALVLDLRGSILELGLPDEDRTWSLTGAACRRSANPPPLQHCPTCLAIFESAPVCPRCGEAKTAKQRHVRVLRKAKALEDYAAKPQWERDKKALHSLRWIACSRIRVWGPRAEEWALSAFRKQFGREPEAEPTEPTR